MKLETRNFFRYWLPALAWTALIFLFSTAHFSAEHTGRILRALLDWLVGGVSAQRFELVHFLVRKSAHVVVYATLSAFWFRAQRGPRSGWRPSWASLALLISLLVALSDEFHQSFLLTRTGTPWDVVLDTFAAFLVQAAIALAARRAPRPQA